MDHLVTTVQYRSVQFVRCKRGFTLWW